MKEPWEFQGHVDKGCKLLDARLGPKWAGTIDLDHLDLQSSCACVLGQTSFDIAGKSNSYSAAADVLFSLEGYPHLRDDDASVDHGFSVDELGSFQALTECWRQTLLSRLEGGSA